MKLFRVELNSHKIPDAYVIAETPNNAYITLRKLLDERDTSFRSDRALKRITVIAEAKQSPDIGHELIVDYKIEDV